MVPSPVLPHGFCLRGAPRAKAGICAEMWLLGLFCDAGTAKDRTTGRKLLLFFIMRLTGANIVCYIVTIDKRLLFLRALRAQFLQ